MLLRSSLLGACSLVVAAVACSSGTGEDVFTPISATTQEALAGTLCNKQEECVSEFFHDIAYGSSDGCRARLTTQIQVDARAPGYAVSEEGGAACNAALGAASCDDVLTGRLPAACDFRGSLADGASCTADAQCESGSCFLASAVSCGRCGPRAALGADCTNARCERGLECGGDGRCTNGEVGAACAKDDDCRLLSVCRSGACAPLLEEGAACVVFPGAADVPCNLFKGFYCKAAGLGDRSGTCTKAVVRLAEAGEACNITALSPFTFTGCRNGECRNDRCVARVADGTSCAADSAPCQEPAACRGGVCALADSTACR